MKSYVLHGVNDLRREDYPVPELKPGWALVRVLAVGICSSDIPRIFQMGTYHFPIIPGHELCGQVESVMDEGDSGWVGKRVGVFPLIPCKNCNSCAKGQYETCSHYNYIGSRRDGGFAEYVAVPVWNLVELPDTVSDIQGALLEPAAVALHAIKRAEMQPGQRACIVGSGTIGMFAGQWAKLQGAEQVYIKGRSEQKRQIVEACGLDYLSGIDCSAVFDCVVEAVGTANALAESLNLVSPGGRIVLMGNPDGDRLLSQDVYWSILRKQLTLIGTWNSSYGGGKSDWTETVQSLSEGKLLTEPVVTHVLDEADLPRGLSIMRDKLQPYCKIVVKMG